jgi:hypothetical protein
VAPRNLQQITPPWTQNQLQVRATKFLRKKSLGENGSKGVERNDRREREKGYGQVPEGATTAEY